MVICSTCHGPHVSFPSAQYFTCCCQNVDFEVLGAASTHIVWILATVFPPQVGIVGITSPVAILNPRHSCASCTCQDGFTEWRDMSRHTLIKRPWKVVSKPSIGTHFQFVVRHTSSKVQGKVRLRPEHLAPLQKLVRAELVCFGLVPRKVWSTPEKNITSTRLANWEVRVPVHSHLEGRWSFGPTPSSQWYVATKLPPGYRTTGISSSLRASSTSFRKPFSSDNEFPGS